MSSEHSDIVTSRMVILQRDMRSLTNSRELKMPSFLYFNSHYLVLFILFVAKYAVKSSRGSVIYLSFFSSYNVNRIYDVQ